jgi:hypothetical protein
MSLLKVNDIQTTGGSPNRGKILQVQSFDTTAVTSGTGFVWTDSGLEVKITPSSSSNKILVFAQAYLSSSVGYSVKCRLVRNGSPIFVGAAVGSRPQVSNEFTATYQSTISYNGQGLPIMYYDNPATTSEITYKVQMASYSTYVVYLNRHGTDANTSEYDSRAASSITVMEVKV